MLGGKRNEALAGSPAVQGKQKLPDLSRSVDSRLELPAHELQLVGKVRSRPLDHFVKRHVFGRRRRVRHTDGKQVRNQIRMPERNSIGKRGSP